MFFVILYMKGCSISYYVDEGLQTKKIDWGGDWGCRIISEEKSRGGGGRFTQKAWGGIPKMQKNKINGVGGVSSKKICDSLPTAYVLAYCVINYQ